MRITMNQLQPNRRGMLFTVLPFLAMETSQSLSGASQPLHIVCVGAHPDDPESGCGGTLARYSEAGHRVSIVYLTRGERGIRGKPLDEAAAIRTAEAREACRILGAQPRFAGQIDGATELNQERTLNFARLLAEEEPDVVFTQWPIDTHPDHQVAALITLRAYYAAPRRFHLYFYEVDAGAQTQGFQPGVYVDITSVREKKKKALFAHRSQHGEEIYSQHHQVMESFRGREARVEAAEAFVHLASNSPSSTVPLL
jgi:LmbE family N-acetylglucosaminyl deacetylase